MTEFGMLQVLKKRYASDAYAVIPQVRNSTGYSSRTRTADALAVSLWPSRGIGIEGFEFKDSRTDWLKELKQPEKAEEISRFCVKWWIVTSSKGVVRDGELPTTWGLMEIVDGVAKVTTKAPAKKPQPPTIEFFAAMCRAAAEYTVPDAEIEKKIDAAKLAEWSKGYAAGKKHEEMASKHIREKHSQLQKVFHDFEAAAGFKIDHYRPDGAKIGKAMKLLTGYHTLTQTLDGIRNTMSVTVREIDEAIAEMKPNEPAAA